MALRTYFWKQRNVSLYKYYKYKFSRPGHFAFARGNAGDIFNIDLIKFLYQQEAIYVPNEGNRLLLVGSIVSKIREGDIVSGIGSRGNDMSAIANLVDTLKIYGVRGPLTRSLFEKYNADLSNLKFEYDPGLLIKEVYGMDLKKRREERVIFIPHFQDWAFYGRKFPNNIKVINVDNSPKKIGKEILKAKVVYSSSLHGIIFSHALNKPCVFVKPQSDEPIFKYRDYFLSVGLDMPEGLKNIYNLNFLTDKPTELKKNIGLADFSFPSSSELMDKGILF